MQQAERPDKYLENSTFWQGFATDQLLLSQCQDCNSFFHFSPRRCAECYSHRLSWVPSSGMGIIQTYTIVHRAPSPNFKSDVPYTLGIVRLDEGPRMMCRIDIDVNQIAIGQQVKINFENQDGKRNLPTFILADIVEHVPST